MAIIKSFKDFPGYKTITAIGNKLPFNNTVKQVLLGVGIGAVVLAGIAIGYVGVLALIGFGGFLLAAPLLVQLGVMLSLTALFGFIVQVSTTLYNFDWNISDKEIDNTIKTAFDNIYSIVGETIGQFLGYVVGGGLAGTLALRWSPALAANIFAEVGQEAKEEILANLSRIVVATATQAANVQALRFFKSARRAIKRPDHPLHDTIKNAMGAKEFEKWGKDGNEPLVFSDKVEERIEKIKDPKMKNLVEGAYEGFFDALVESGFTSAGLADTFMASQALMNKKAGLGADDDVIEIDFDPPTQKASSTAK